MKHKSALHCDHRHGRASLLLFPFLFLLAVFSRLKWASEYEEDTKESVNRRTAQKFCCRLSVWSRKGCLSRDDVLHEDGV